MKKSEPNKFCSVSISIPQKIRIELNQTKLPIKRIVLIVLIKPTKLPIEFICMLTFLEL